MKRRIRVAAVSSLLALGALGLVACGGDDETTGSEETLTFDEDNEGSRYEPIGDYTIGSLLREGPSPGNGFTLSIPLLDASGETVGEINGFCIATRPGTRKGTCSGTADVPDGQLAFIVGGEVFVEVRPPGEIVGGTGKYEGATGTFTTEATGAETTDTFNIILP
jgi:hypothetical protein